MTGQVFARGPFPGPNGKPVYILVGLVSGDELVGGTQYTIAVPPVLVDPIDRSEETKGWGIEQLVRAPIWRI